MSVLAVVVMAAGVPGQVAVAEELPRSPRAYLTPGESVADAHYILRFGRYGQGTNSLAGTGMENRVGHLIGRSLRLFEGKQPTNPNPRQPEGMYHIAYKGTCCGGEQVTQHLPNRIALWNSILYDDQAWFDGTALWLGHSRFQPGAAPPTGESSPTATGTRDDGSIGPADGSAAVRADDGHLLSIPVVPNVETKRSFLVTTHVWAPRHPGVRYQLRPQPYLDRGGLGLTGPAGTGNRAIDLAPFVERFVPLYIRADVVTHGGTRTEQFDDTGKVTYRYFLDNVQVGTADTLEMIPTSLHRGVGDVRFGPAFALLRGWQGDAPEVFIDNIAVYDIQNMPFRTSWIGETILPQDAAKYALDRYPANERHVAQKVRALWVDPVPGPDGKKLIFANSDYDEGGNGIGVYSYEIVDGRGVIRPYSTLGPYGHMYAGFAITGDSGHIYANHQNANISCISRFARARVEPDIPVPAEGTNLCLPDRPSAERPFPNIRGLAAGPDHLFVSLSQYNEVRVYRKDQLTTPIHTASVPDARGMAYGPNGRLWVIVNGQAPRVQEYRVDANGVLTPGRSLTRPGLVPSALATDTRGLLYVANDASTAQQIQVFDTTTLDPQPPEVMSKRLGDAGGVTAFGGAYGPARFDGLTGIAVDNDGNNYVASNGVGASAAEGPLFLDIRRFNGASKALEAQVQSYLSTAIVAPDPADPGVVYSPAQRYELNLDSQVPGTEWAPEKTTLMTDRYTCPHDPRVGGMHQQAAIAVRYMGTGPERRKFLFVTGQGGVHWIGLYRFTEDGKRTRPSVFFSQNTDNKTWPPNEPGQLWSWRDTNDDCQFNDFEYGPSMNLGFMGSNLSVSEQDNQVQHELHRAGDIWVDSSDGKLRRVPFTGTFERGSPVYATDRVEAMPLPQPFAAVEGLVYQSATDTLYLLGRSNNDPSMRTGWQLARYNNFYANHLREKAQTGPGPSPKWLEKLPDDVATFCPDDDKKLCRPYTLTAAGDRVYVSSAAPPTPLLYGRIRMYDAESGARRGSLVPGPEVAHHSPNHDMRHAVTAMQLADGRRYAFAEENHYGKVLLYKGF